MNLSDKELDVVIREFQALSEFLNEPENDRNDKRQIRAILKKARAEKEKRANKACTGLSATPPRKRSYWKRDFLARIKADMSALSQ
jgi:hypothetical protein